MTYMARIIDCWEPPRGRAPEEVSAIRHARLGDRDTFVRIIASYDTAIFRLAWHFTQSASDAAEIYQDVFTGAYRLMPSYTGDESLLIWIFRIATRYCLAYAQAPVMADSMPGSAPDDARIPIRLRRAVMHLGPRERLVFILRHELQFKAATIARMLDLPETTVQASLTRAFLLLRSAAQAIGTKQ